MESLERKDTTVATEEPVKNEGPVVPSPAASDRSNGGVSPPPHCSICLGGLVNTSFTDSCLHQFCFTCLLQWAKIKTECPLCKQTFKSIIHNVRSEGDYDQYHVPYTSQVTAAAATLDVTADIHVNGWAFPYRPFMYRTTNWASSRRYGVVLNAEAVARREQIPSIAPTLSSEERRRRVAQPMEFRRRVYREGLWASPLADGFGRFRQTSPAFYRIHPEEVERLIPWLNREIQVVMNSHHIVYLLNRITESLTCFNINSDDFRFLVRPYLRQYAEHFQHEFYNFARSNFDMVGYDHVITYTPRRDITGLSNEFLPGEVSADTTSSSSSSSDSEVRVIDHVSDTRNSIHPVHFINSSGPSSFLPSIRHIEPDIVTVSSESSESEGECEVVGIVKPRHERTPEIIDLSSEEENRLEVVNLDIPSTPQENNQPELLSTQDEDLNLPSTSSAGAYSNNNGSKRTRRCTEDTIKSLYDYMDSSSDSNSDETDSDYNPSSKRKSRRSHKSSSKKSSKSLRKLRPSTKSGGSSRSARKKQKSSSTRNRSESYSCEEENDTRDMSSRHNRKRYHALSDSNSDYGKLTKKSKKSKKSKNSSPTREVSHEHGSARYSSDSESDYEKSRKKAKKNKKSKSSKESKRRCVLIQTSKIPKARIYKLKKMSSSDDDFSSPYLSSCSNSDYMNESKNKNRKKVKRKSTSSTSSPYRNLSEDHSSKEDYNQPSCSKSTGSLIKTFPECTGNIENLDDWKPLRNSLSHLKDNNCGSNNGDHSDSYSEKDDYTPLQQALKSNKSTKASSQPTSTCQSRESSPAPIPSTSKYDSPTKHSESSSSSKSSHDVWQSHYQKCKESKTRRRSHS